MLYKQDSITMADNFGGSENIYFEEISNVVLIDPNSVRDSSGVKKDRVIKQENLVMYANLEANAVPRTRLAVGQDVESSINNTTVASINFLKPNDKNSFDTSYTDETTGAGSAQGQGINQIKFNNGQNPQLNNYVDTQILGIRDINVDIKFNGVPTVTMTLVDVQGKSLFQTGGNSPYSVFLYYPYPLFKLTLKGYYGKAIQYELMLLNFQASFEASTGNYIVNLKFIARTSAMLDDIRLGYLFALPHMYGQYSIPNTPTVNTSNSATASVQQNGTGVTTEVTVESTSKGYSKIKQVFEEYKRQGLIDQNVPVITLNEMQIRLTKYTEFLNNEFDKLDFTSIVALERYKESLNNFSNKVVQWGQTYLETYKNEIIEGNFPLDYINYGFLHKKRLSIESTYSRIGYIEKSVDQLNTIVSLIENSTKNDGNEMWISMKEPYNINSLIHPKLNSKVIAFSDPNIALLNSINFSDGEVKKNYNGSEISLKELKPNGVKKLKTRRFLYLVETKTFLPHEKGNNQKFFSQLPVKILAKERIDNVHDYLIGEN